MADLVEMGAIKFKISTFAPEIKLTSISEKI